MAEITLYPYNILESGTVTVTGDPDTGFPESRLWDRDIGLFWQDTVTEAKEFEADQGASSILSVDTLIIDRHNFDGVAMQWQYSDDGAAWSDAVTDWTQSGNGQIVKTLGAAADHQWWKVTLASMANPMCSEFYMTRGYSFDVQANPAPQMERVPNVQWNRTAGGIERSTKFGDIRNRYQYTLFLEPSELADLETVLDYLDQLSKPFYLKDTDGSIVLVRLLDNPLDNYDHRSATHITLNMIKKL